MPEQQTVAVTGVETSFGRRLLDALERDPGVRKVVALDTKAPGEARSKVTFRRIDLVHPRSGEQLAEALREAQADVVIHTAFLARPVHGGGWAHDLEAIGTRNVLAAVEAVGTRKLLLRSSTLSYGALPSHPARIPESAPLAGARQSAFIADKVEAEEQATRFSQRHAGRVVTLLRFAPILGPTTDTISATYLRRRVCPTLLGYDPLVQFVHESDAIEATRLAVHRDVRGAVNVAAHGVVRLSGAIRLAGRRACPCPGFLMRRTSELLWTAQLGDFPPGLVDFLKYACVADVTRMRDQLQFTPAHDVRAAIQSFARTARQPDAAAN